MKRLFAEVWRDRLHKALPSSFCRRTFRETFFRRAKEVLASNAGNAHRRRQHKEKTFRVPKGSPKRRRAGTNEPDWSPACDSIHSEANSMFLVPRKFLFLLFIFGGGVAANAQSTLASINGTIQDGTEATVPGAAITLHREQSNTDRRVTAGADGSYTALNLEPGTYSVRVEREGFAPKTSTHLQLDPRAAASAGRGSLPRGREPDRAGRCQRRRHYYDRQRVDLRGPQPPRCARPAGKLPRSRIDLAPERHPDPARRAARLRWLSTDTFRLTEPGHQVLHSGRSALAVRDHGRRHLRAEPDLEQHPGRCLPLGRIHR